MQELRDLPGEVPSLLKALQTSFGLVAEPRVDSVEKQLPPAADSRPAGAAADGLANNSTGVEELSDSGTVNIVLWQKAFKKSKELN